MMTYLRVKSWKCDDRNTSLVLLVPGVVDQEVLPEVDHLLEVHAAADGGLDQAVEILRGTGVVLQHELEVSEGVEDVLGAQLPGGPAVQHGPLLVQPRCVLLAAPSLGESVHKKHNHDLHSGTNCHIPVSSQHNVKTIFSRRWRRRQKKAVSRLLQQHGRSQV